MTFVGKLLVVLQLVLSICFMAFAGAVYTFQTKWRTQYEATQTKLEEVTRENEARKATIRKYNDLARTTLGVASNADPAFAFDQQGDLVEQGLATAEAKVAEAQTLKTERDDAIRQMENEQKQNANRESQLITAVTETDLATQAREDAQTTSSLLNEVYLSAQERIDDLEDERRKKSDEAFALEQTLKEVERKYNDLLTDNARVRQLVRQLGGDPEAKPQRKDAPPPSVEGLVLNTRKTRASVLIEVSIGSDDGLKDGDELFVFRTRDSKYLGKIELVLVTPDRAVGAVVEKAKNGTIERGDNVATKLGT